MHARSLWHRSLRVPRNYRNSPSATAAVLLVAAVLACFSVFGIETTSGASIIGAAGLAVGLGFQGILSNFSAGVMLLVFRPFKVNDYVVVGGKKGVVSEIVLFSTALDTLDNRRIYGSNTSIGAGAIENSRPIPCAGSTST
jgi:small conductance mechanosensitive channel